jgi:hypothetical protein
LVESESGCDVFTLIFLKPLGLLREVGEPEIEKDADKNGYATFYNKDPAPTTIAAHTIHTTNGGREQSAKGTSECRAVEEERISALSFMSTVPHTNQVES